MRSNTPTILLIYTGGTIGMIQDTHSKALRPIDFEQVHAHIPEINDLGVHIKAISFKDPIDSSNMRVQTWNEIAQIIQEQYDLVDGFVVLHGSDTMSYTASALSFMLEGLSKPVILTGSQLPIGVNRTDGKENIITAIEIAASQKNNKPLIQEVCVYFEYQLYRGNRTHKYSAEHFEAFISPNYPVLANAGVHITYNEAALREPTNHPFRITYLKEQNIAVLSLFPGITQPVLEAYLQMKDLKGLVIHSFGSGNIPNYSHITSVLTELSHRGVLLLNVTQCNVGKVKSATYATNPDILNVGMVDAADITLESAIAKLLYVLSLDHGSKAQQLECLSTNLRGEITL